MIYQFISVCSNILYRWVTKHCCFMSAVVTDAIPMCRNLNWWLTYRNYIIPSLSFLSINTHLFWFVLIATSYQVALPAVQSVCLKKPSDHWHKWRQGARVCGETEYEAFSLLTNKPPVCVKVELQRLASTLHGDASPTLCSGCLNSEKTNLWLEWCQTHSDENLFNFEDSIHCMDV